MAPTSAIGAAAVEDPHSFSDLRQGRTTHVHMALVVDLQRRVLTGTATLEADRPGKGPLDLDVRDLKVRRVTDGAGRELPFVVGETDAIRGQRLRIERPSPVQTVTIEYETSPAASALQWLEPAQTAGGKHPFMFSQSQSIHARSIVPLQDTAQARITFAAELTVPKPLTAVMAARADGFVDAADGSSRTFRFTMPQTIPPYLLALAVGELSSKKIGPRTRVYAEPSRLEAAAHEFAEVESMITAAEKLFGPYPWEQFDVLLMPPSFPYGGMENPRLTFVTPSLLTGDRSLVNVLEHELAHSWTGNLITNATNEHFWLNEGFTVWAERRICEARRGRDAAEMAAALGRKSLEETLAHAPDKWEYSKLHTHLHDVDPDIVYSSVPYEKGYLFLRLLEETVGRPAWDAFVAEYIERFSFGTITTEAFMEFLEARFPGLAEEVHAAAWLDAPGIPPNAPLPDSQRLRQLEAAAAALVGPASGRPAVAGLTAGGWDATDWQVFLGALPDRLDPAVWRDLDRRHRLSVSSNTEIAARWLTIGVTSGVDDAVAPALQLVASVGRMKFLKPLYRALHDNPQTAARAQAWFLAHADSHHAIARRVVANLLGVSL